MENSGLAFLGFVSLYPWKNSAWFASASTSACAGIGPGVLFQPGPAVRNVLLDVAGRRGFFLLWRL